jgi:hypothetical protein
MIKSVFGFPAFYYDQLTVFGFPPFCFDQLTVFGFPLFCFDQLTVFGFPPFFFLDQLTFILTGDEGPRGRLHVHAVQRARNVRDVWRDASARA